MKSVLVFALFSVICLPIFLIEADAFGQTGGDTTLDLKPGESDTFVWGLISSEDRSVVIELSAVGKGSEFLIFPDTMTFEPNEKLYQTFEVRIPADYPGGITLYPEVHATDAGKDMGSTTINIQMVKEVTLNIAPNDDASLRVDWEALKAEQEAQALASKNAESAVEPLSQEESSESTTIVQTQSSPQIPEKSAGSTSILPSESAMDPEPSKPIINPESQVLQIDTEEGGGCLIATATYGSEMAPQVQMLRETRDNTLLTTQSGTAFMTAFNQLYYSFSPTIADWERQSPAFKELVKITITPLLTTLSILDYVDINSEAQMLGWGLSIIALNLAMYVAAPTLGSYKFSKYLRNRK